MKKCISCGAELKEGENFCSYCGNRAAASDTAHDRPKTAAASSGAVVVKPDAVQKTKILLSIVSLRGPLGNVKQAPVGFSWTVLFFGPLVLLFRKDFAKAAIWFIAWWVWVLMEGDSAEGYLTISVIFFIVQIIAAFNYNKVYIIGLLKKGYKPYSENDGYTLHAKGII